MQRILVRLGIAAAVLILCAAAVRAVQNPMDERRAQLEAGLRDAPAEADSTGLGSPGDYGKLKNAIESKATLWDPLTPPLVAGPPPINVEQELAGIKVRPGYIGGANPKVRLDTPEATGQWFKKGDTVRGNVVVQDITDDAVILSITKDGKSITHQLPMR